MHDQTLLAYNSLHLLFDKVSLDIKTNCTDLKFWGVYNYKDVDKLPFRFLKSLLAVKKQTQNSAVYREFDRYSLSVICKLRSLKFWLKIMINISSPLYIMYRDQGNNISGPCWSQTHKFIVRPSVITELTLMSMSSIILC